MTTNCEGTWTKKYSIMNFHPDCFNEFKKYNDRQKKMNDEIMNAQIIILLNILRSMIKNFSKKNSLNVIQIYWLLVLI